VKQIFCLSQSHRLKKKYFSTNIKNIIKAPFIMGVGGSFDVIAGVTKRAPIWMQKAGLEWFLPISPGTQKNVEKIFNWKFEVCSSNSKTKIRIISKSLDGN
jgi:UDP-N-acetyl-D-mannosaminuronic acid transferase (WecB/TagA/CpsF family)